MKGAAKLLFGFHMMVQHPDILMGYFILSSLNSNTYT